MGAGFLKAWAILLIGAAIGYGVGALFGWRLGWPLTHPSCIRLNSPGALNVVVMFGLGGFVIEILRFQGRPGKGHYFRAWSSAAGLRRRLYLVLGAAAICVGMFTALRSPGA